MGAKSVPSFFLIMVDTYVLRNTFFFLSEKNDESNFYEVVAMSINYSFQFKHSLSGNQVCAAMCNAFNHRERPAEVTLRVEHTQDGTQ